MITAIKDMHGAAAAKVSEFLEACNLLFERGLLSSNSSQVLNNISNGLKFFEMWCYLHSQTGKWNELTFNFHLSFINFCLLVVKSPYDFIGDQDLIIIV